jgi:solute:Na+ symporter, SSS family
MDFITIISFLGFTALVAVVTWFMTKGQHIGESKDGYFLGGRSLTWGIIAGSLMLTQISAFNLVGLSSQGYRQNMASMSWSVAVGLPMVIVGLYFMPKYLRQGITTIPDFIENRFDGSTRYAIAILFILSYFINLLPTALYTGAMVMSQVFNIGGKFGISYNASIWVTIWALGIIGGCYAIFGGLKAIAVSDTLNGIGLVIGGLAVPIFALSYLGDGSISTGLTQLLTTNTEKLNSIGGKGSFFPIAIFFTGAFLMNIQFQGCDQAQIQRTLGAKNLAHAQKGYLIAALLKMLTPFVLIIPGIIAFHIYKGKTFANPDMVFSTLVNDVMPKPLLGFFAAVIFGAILSTFNSVLNSAATLITLNIVKPMSKKERTERQYVTLGRNISIVLALISMIIAPLLMYVQGIYQYFQTVTSFFAFPTLLVIVIGYLTKRI